MTPYDLSRLNGAWLTIIKPSFGVSTPQAYSGVVPRIPEIPLVQRLDADISSWRECLTNDFERTVFPQHPSLIQIKEQLYQSGAFYASMSGSGSAMYGLYDHSPAYQPAYADERIFCARL